MNWATYKTLTKEQREEYNFKFGQRPQLSHTKIITLAIMLMMTIVILIFVSYLILTSTNEDLIKLKPNINSLFYTGVTVTNAVIILIIFYVVYDVGNLFSYIVRLYWWRKKNKIKYRYDSWVERIWGWIKHLFV